MQILLAPFSLFKVSNMNITDVSLSAREIRIIKYALEYFKNDYSVDDFLELSGMDYEAYNNTSIEETDIMFEDLANEINNIRNVLNGN